MAQSPRSTPSTPAPRLRVVATPAPLRQQVVQRLRGAIAEGHFRPGDRLVERELCEQLGVSRTSLREALRELENDGIVTSLANRGVIVSTISDQSAREVYEVRGLLEALIARRFAEHASAAQLAELGQRIDALAQAYASQDGVVTAKHAFYEALMAGADHQLAASMLRGIQLRASQLRVMTLSDPERARHSIAEIRALFKALKRRDPDAAAAAALQHVHNAGTLALRLLGAADAVPAPAAPRRRAARG
ncbi:MAG: GntR family transcriptional regulator [Rubrivivax sp.]